MRERVKYIICQTSILCLIVFICPWFQSLISMSFKVRCNYDGLFLPCGTKKRVVYNCISASFMKKTHLICLDNFCRCNCALGKYTRRQKLICRKGWGLPYGVYREYNYKMYILPHFPMWEYLQFCKIQSKCYMGPLLDTSVLVKPPASPTYVRGERRVRERSQMTSYFFGPFLTPLPLSYFSGQFACFSPFNVTPCQLLLTPPPQKMTSFVNAP